MTFFSHNFVGGYGTTGERALRQVFTIFIIVLLALVSCTKGLNSGSSQFDSSLTSVPTPYQYSGGNGEPVQGDGWANLYALCTNNTSGQQGIVAVIQSSELTGMTALLILGEGEAQQMVEPVSVTLNGTQISAPGLVIDLAGSASRLQSNINNSMRNEVVTCTVVQ